MKISLILAALFASAQPAALELEAVAKVFVKTLANEDFAAATKDFDAAMKKVLPAKKLEELWKGLLAQGGAFQKTAGSRQERVGKYQVLYVTCAFAKLKLDAKVVFDNDRKITGLFFVPPPAKYKIPTYVRPDSFQEQDVTVGAKSWNLPGTLSIPKGPGRFPAILLIQGSGPQDRDETIGPNKPFRDLAWGLASRNLAVLRYEKRTKAHAGKMGEWKDKITIKEDVVDDALAALTFLRKQQRIDAKRIFVLGHSLGGTLGPRIAQLDARVAGLIIMAGATRPLEDLILEQFTYIFSLDGGPSKENQKELARIARQVKRARDPQLSPMISAKELPLGVPAVYWLSLRGAPATDIAKTLHLPMLILQGDRDYQVTAADFQGWKKALAGQTNVNFKNYPGLNHLFIAGAGMSRPTDYERAGHVAVVVIEDIARWIHEH